MLGQSGDTGMTSSTGAMGTGSQSMGGVTNSRIARDVEGTGEREFNSQSKGLSGRGEQEARHLTSSGHNTAGSDTKEAEHEEGGFMGKVKKTLGI